MEQRKTSEASLSSVRELTPPQLLAGDQKRGDHVRPFGQRWKRRGITGKTLLKEGSELRLVVVGDQCGGGLDERAGIEELDLALFTRMGKARNVINVLSADVVVICGGGGPGTASEAAHALNAGRPLILLAMTSQWREFFCSLRMGVQSASNVQECCRLIEARLTEA